MKRKKKNSPKFDFSPVRFKRSENRLERTLIAPFLVTSKFHIFQRFLGFKLITGTPYLALIGGGTINVLTGPGGPPPTKVRHPSKSQPPTSALPTSATQPPPHAPQQQQNPNPPPTFCRQVWPIPPPKPSFLPDPQSSSSILILNPSSILHSSSSILIPIKQVLEPNGLSNFGSSHFGLSQNGSSQNLITVQGLTLLLRPEFYCFFTVKKCSYFYVRNTI